MTASNRIMGIDHGEKWIGVALTDPLGLFASPYSVIGNKGKKHIFPQLRKIIHEKDVAKIVIGLPMASDGGIGKQATTVIYWTRSLRAEIDIPIVFWDESYSSSDALKHTTRKRKHQAHRVDDVAAAGILEDYLLNVGDGEHEPGQTLEAYEGI